MIFQLSLPHSAIEWLLAFLFVLMCGFAWHFGAKLAGKIG